MFQACARYVCLCDCVHVRPAALNIAYLQGGIKTGGLFTLGSSFRAKQPCLSVIQIGGFTTRTRTHTGISLQDTLLPLLPVISLHLSLLLPYTTQCQHRQVNQKHPIIYSSSGMPRANQIARESERLQGHKSVSPQSP